MAYFPPGRIESLFSTNPASRGDTVDGDIRRVYRHPNGAPSRRGEISSSERNKTLGLVVFCDLLAIAGGVALVVNLGGIRELTRADRATLSHLSVIE